MFSLAYFKYLIKSNKALLICVVLVNIISILLGGGRTISNDFIFSISIVLCYVLPILTLKYVHDSKAVDTYFSLPIKKKSLIITGTIYNIIVAYVPFGVSSFIIQRFNNVSLINNIYLWLIALFVGCVALIVFNSIVYLFANNTLDGVIILAAYTALPLALYLTLCLFYETFVCGYQYNTLRDILLEYISPVALYFKLYSEVLDLSVLIAALVFTVVLIPVLLISFNSRKVERAGKSSNNLLAYPLIINLYAVVVIFAISCGSGKCSNILDYLQENIVYYLLVFIFYLSARFIYKRKFYFDIKMPILFICTITLSILFSIFTLNNKAFGLSNIYSSYKNDTRYNINLYNYNDQHDDIKKWIEDKIGETTEYLYIDVDAYDSSGLDKQVVNKIEEIRKKSIEQFYDVDNDINADQTLYLGVYENYNDYDYRSSYSYYLYEYVLSIDDLIELASHNGVTVTFYCDKRSYELDKQGKLVYREYYSDVYEVENAIDEIVYD